MDTAVVKRPEAIRARGSALDRMAAGLPPVAELVSDALQDRPEEGRIAEDWDVFDLLTPLLRLGASIVPGTA